MKICIDAGHNYSGWNTGTTGCGLREQDITWQIAERLRIRLERVGFEVIMTRPTLETNLGTDNDGSLRARYILANDNNCDLFVSIHCNSGGGSGTETLIYKSGSAAEKLAWRVQQKIVERLAMRNRGVKLRPDLAVLKNTKMPAILVETAFIDNGSDADKLVNNQEDFAAAICAGVCGYCGIEVREETAREKAERIIRKRCDTPQVWLDRLDTVPYFAEFVCKIGG